MFVYTQKKKRKDFSCIPRTNNEKYPAPCYPASCFYTLSSPLFDIEPTLTFSLAY